MDAVFFCNPESVSACVRCLDLCVQFLMFCVLAVCHLFYLCVLCCALNAVPYVFAFVLLVFYVAALCLACLLVISLAVSFL